MPDLLTLAINSNLKVTACPIHEYWLDVGQPETLSKPKVIGKIHFSKFIIHVFKIRLNFKNGTKKF